MMNRLESAGITIDAPSTMSVSDATEVDLEWALDVLLTPAAGVDEITHAP
jgi:hypothetical protein